MTRDLAKHFLDANEMSICWLVIDITCHSMVMKIKTVLITGTMVMLLDYILSLKTTTLWKVVKLVAFLKGPFVMQDDSLSLFFAYGT